VRGGGGNGKVTWSSRAEGRFWCFLGTGRKGCDSRGLQEGGRLTGSAIRRWRMTLSYRIKPLIDQEEWAAGKKGYEDSAEKKREIS